MKKISSPLSKEKNKEARPRIPAGIWVLVAAAFLIALGYGLIAPIIPQFASSFDVSMAAAGAVVSIFAASRLLFAPASGKLVDTLGSRKVYLTGLLTVAVTTGLVSLATQYWHILLLRGIGGIGSTMFTVSAMGLVISMAPPSIRGRCSSLYASAFLMGNIIGPVLGAALAMLGMRAPFAIYGSMVALAAFVVWWRMPAGIGARRKESESSLPPLTFRTAIRDSAYRSALVGAFANGWSNFGVRVAALPLFAATIFHHSGSIAGIALAAYAVGSAIALQFSGALADRWGRKPLILVGLAVNTVFSASIGFATTVPLLLGLSAAAGLGAGCLNPAQQAVVGDVIGRERSGGKALANFQMAQDCGAILGPILVGMIASRWGFEAGFMSCGVIGLVAILVWLKGRETLQTAKPTQLAAD
ncbi:MFS transporter [Corynebacterium uropygiale]|uniref:MFS transporter n=1 Tax=Corynebacterium uropygiale TaxID=1775911 RepID=A0A9X1U0W2_9CORY|nr:MFS transporter [Corynebacterium uropygiale]MCF4006918.1 MFS transporter [Corynebacterium uropygiale]